MVAFSVESMVRGYHVYQKYLDSQCWERTAGRNDPFAVAVIDATSSIVGHVLLLKKT